MQDNKTALVLLLDKSGSMKQTKQSAIDGFNELLDAQDIDGVETVVSYYEFSGQPNAQYALQPLEEAERLTQHNYRPGGLTALYDTLVQAIDETGEKLAAMPEGERPANVLVVTITDGVENNSRASIEDVRSRVEHQREKYDWAFQFIGANQDAVLTAERMGMNPGSAITYSANDEGTQNVLSASANMAAKYTQTGTLRSYTDKEREKAMADSD